MKYRLSILILSIAASSFGQIPSTSIERRSPAADVQYTFNPPRGWKQQENDPGWTLTSPAESVIILVKPHAENDFAKAVRTTEIDSTYKVIGDPRSLDNGGKSFRVSKVLANGTTGIVDCFIMLSPNGGGVIVMALSGPANSEGAYKMGLAVASSVAFPRDFASTPSAPRPEAPMPSGSDSPWAARLSNKHLLYLYSGNGYFEERHYYICSSGTFYYKAGSGGFTPGNSDGGSYAGRSGNSGRWGVSGSTLVLQYQNGNVVRLNLTERQKSSEIGLNGNRYFIEPQPNCQ